MHRCKPPAPRVSTVLGWPARVVDGLGEGTTPKAGSPNPGTGNEEERATGARGGATVPGGGWPAPDVAGLGGETAPEAGPSYPGTGNEGK